MALGALRYTSLPFDRLRRSLRLPRAIGSLSALNGLFLFLPSPGLPSPGAHSPGPRPEPAFSVGSKLSSPRSSKTDPFPKPSPRLVQKAPGFPYSPEANGRSHLGRESGVGWLMIAAHYSL